MLGLLSILCEFDKFSSVSTSASSLVIKMIHGMSKKLSPVGEKAHSLLGVAVQIRKSKSTWHVQQPRDCTWLQRGGSFFVAESTGRHKSRGLFCSRRNNVSVFSLLPD